MNRHSVRVYFRYTTKNFLPFHPCYLEGGSLGHCAVPMVDGDAGLTGGDADGVAEPGVGRSLRVHHVAGRVSDENGCALVCTRTDKELKN